MKHNCCVALLISILSMSAFALPLDVSGSFYVDSVYINSYRGTDQNLSTSGNAGSQEVPSTGTDSDSALFQSYIFRLNPSIIVNDSVTIKGEITNGALRGGFLGDDGRNFSGQRPLQSLYINTAGGNSDLTLNQAYAEIYSNTALFKVGRFAKHWGLGLVQNDGSEVDDRFFTMMDGVQATFQFQNFSFTPYWARISSGAQQDASDDVREIGVSVTYENKDAGIEVGILANERTAEYDSAFYSNNKVELKLYDFYVKREWDNFELGFEAPYVTGSFGTQDIEAYAGVLNTRLNLSDTWSLNGVLGAVSGQDDGADVSVMGLHPNFQVAHLLFRYNMYGVEDPTINVFDSQISNAVFAKIAAEYEKGNWGLEFALIYAKANQAASAGSSAYNHSTGTAFTATANQQDDLGLEVDFTARYQWYPNVNISLKLAYLSLGDYYAFTNTGTELDLSNPWLASVGLGIDF